MDVLQQTRKMLKKVKKENSVVEGSSRARTQTQDTPNGNWTEAYKMINWSIEWILRHAIFSQQPIEIVD